MEHQQSRNNYLINSEALAQLNQQILPSPFEHDPLRKDLSRAFEECYQGMTLGGKFQLSHHEPHGHSHHLFHHDLPAHQKSPQFGHKA